MHRIPTLLAVALTSSVLLAGQDPALAPAPATTSFAWGDWNGDGLADPLVISRAGGCHLFENLGDGSFEDVTEAAGLVTLTGVRQALWRDFDLDGRQDLFVLRPQGASLLLRNVDGACFDDVGATSGLDLGRGLLLARWRDYDRDGLADLELADHTGQRLYRNLGRGFFAAVRLELDDEDPAVARIASTTAQPGAMPPIDAGGGAQGPAGPPFSEPICTIGVRDLANQGVCLGAASVPMLGMLYPLSVHLFVDTSGNVGVGTTSPLTRLDVVGGDIRTDSQLISTTAALPPLEVQSSQLVTELNADLLDGFHASAFSQLGDSIEGFEITDGTIEGMDLASGAVTTPKLAPAAVDGSRIAPGSIDDSHVSAGAMIAGDKVVADFGPQPVRTSGQLVSTATAGAPLEVSSSTVVDGLNADLLDGVHASAFSQLGDSIEGTEISDGTIQEMDLAPGAVTTPILAAGSINDSHVSPGAMIAGAKIDADFGPQPVRTGGQLVSTATSGAPLAVSSSALVPGLNADLLDGAHASAFSQLGPTIEGAEITDGTITAADLGAGSVTASEIAGGSITNAHVSVAAAIAGTKIDPDFGDQNIITTGWIHVSSPIFNGVHSVSDGVGADGLHAWANALTGPSWGVHGGTDSVDGVGVYGEAYASTGAAVGTVGWSNSAAGTGVFGFCSHPSGGTIGVRGQIDSEFGFGVYGRATSTQGSSFGILGEAESPGGRGVYGWGLHQTGSCVGVYGNTSSPAGYGVYSSGDFGASGTKYFVQPHPTDASKEVRFVCLEGNESGTYFRGSAQLLGGACTIEVPEEFRLVSEAEGLTLQLTPIGAPAVLWIESQDLERIVVRGSEDVEFHYFANGVRRGFQDLEPVRENNAFVPKVRGVPFGSQYPAAYRQILIDNGILNPDLTPNEATAASLGWELVEPGSPEARGHGHGPAPTPPPVKKH